MDQNNSLQAYTGGTNNTLENLRAQMLQLQEAYTQGQRNIQERQQHEQAILQRYVADEQRRALQAAAPELRRLADDALRGRAAEQKLREMPQSVWRTIVPQVFPSTPPQANHTIHAQANTSGACILHQLQQQTGYNQRQASSRSQAPTRTAVQSSPISGSCTAGSVPYTQNHAPNFGSVPSSYTSLRPPPIGGNSLNPTSALRPLTRPPNAVSNNLKTAYHETSRPMALPDGRTTAVHATPVIHADNIVSLGTQHARVEPHSTYRYSKSSLAGALGDQLANVPRPSNSEPLPVPFSAQNTHSVASTSKSGQENGVTIDPNALEVQNLQEQLIGWNIYGTQYRQPLRTNLGSVVNAAPQTTPAISSSQPVAVPSVRSGVHNGSIAPTSGSTGSANSEASGNGVIAPAGGSELSEPLGQATLIKKEAMEEESKVGLNMETTRDSSNERESMSEKTSTVPAATVVPATSAAESITLMPTSSTGDYEIMPQISVKPAKSSPAAKFHSSPVQHLISGPSVSGSPARVILRAATRSENPPPVIQTEDPLKPPPGRTVEDANIYTLASDIIWALRGPKRPRRQEGTHVDEQASGSSVPTPGVDARNPLNSSRSSTHSTDKHVSTFFGAIDTPKVPASIGRQTPNSAGLAQQGQFSAHSSGTLAPKSNSYVGLFNVPPPQAGQGYAIVEGVRMPEREAPLPPVDYILSADEHTRQATVIDVGTGLPAPPIPYQPLAFSPTVPAFIETIPDPGAEPKGLEALTSSAGAFDEDTALEPFEARDNDPLFLPSPVVSATPESYGPPHDDDFELPPRHHMEHLERMPGPFRGRQVIVELPKLSAAQKRKYRSVEQEGRRTVARVDSDRGFVEQPVAVIQKRVETPLTVITNMATDDTSYAGDSSLQIHSSEEEMSKKCLAYEALSLAENRLSKHSCQWKDCSFTGKDTWTLRAHVQAHIPTKVEIFSCLYGECRRHFHKQEALATHLSNHVRRDISCAYQGCTKILKNPSDYVSHITAVHQEGGSLKQSSAPFVPSSKDLPPLLETDAYLSISLQVQPALMSSDQRKLLGPWVLKNTFGKVNLGVPRYDARNQLVSGHIPPLNTAASTSGLEINPSRAILPIYNPSPAPAPGASLSLRNALPQPVPDKADFLDKFISPRTYPLPGSLCDISHEKVSTLIANGAVFLPDKEGPQGSRKEWLITSLARQADETVYPGGSSGDTGERRYTVKELRDSVIGEGDSFDMHEPVKEEDLTDACSLPNEASASAVVRSIAVEQAQTMPAL